MILDPSQPAPDLDPGQHFGHEELDPRWEVVELYGQGYYLVLRQRSRVLRTHPIGFNSHRDAERAAARLNSRDQQEQGAGSNDANGTGDPR